MTEEPERQDEPDDEKLKHLAATGEAAIAEGKDPMAAMTAMQKQLENMHLSDEDMDRLAARLVEQLPPAVGEWFRGAGAFDPPPEPVAPPAQPTAPAQLPPATSATPPTPAPRKTFAQRFIGE